MPKIFLPSVKNEGGVAGESSPADELFALMVADPGQKRVGMRLDARLAKAAQLHCEDCLRRGYFSHETPEGVWSNKRVRLTGYVLPNWYDDDKNYVESLDGGQQTVELAWQAWLDSPVHRTHVLGLIPFYAEQICVGVGYFFLPNASLFKHCWAVVSCPPEEGV